MHGMIIGETYIKREKEKDQLRMGGGSWSINLKELKEHVKKVQFESEKGTYNITLEKAREFGFVRILGGEEKLVVPTGYWSFNTRKV